jgi:hypothetical protein
MLALYAVQKPNKRHLTKECFKHLAIIAVGIFLSTLTKSIKNQTACPPKQDTEEQQCIHEQPFVKKQVININVAAC